MTVVVTSEFMWRHKYFPSFYDYYSGAGAAPGDGYSICRHIANHWLTDWLTGAVRSLFKRDLREPPAAVRKETFMLYKWKYYKSAANSFASKMR